MLNFVNKAGTGRSMTSTTSLFSPVEADLRLLSENLKQLVGNRHPILSAAGRNTCLEQEEND